MVFKFNNYFFLIVSSDIEVKNFHKSTDGSFVTFTIDGQNDQDELTVEDIDTIFNECAYFDSNVYQCDATYCDSNCSEDLCCHD